MNSILHIFLLEASRLGEEPLLHPADGRMLQVRKELASWCSKHSLQLADLDAYSDILGFKASEVQKHCAKIEMVRHLTNV